MPRQIFLFSDIYTGTAELIINQLLALDRESGDEITMFINSRGGEVNAMFSIIDIMSAIRSPIRTIVTGQAASAAAVIASSGKKRLITENARIMIHEVWSIVGGSISEIDDAVTQMTKEQEKLINILAKNTGKTDGEIKFMIKKADKYFDANEAKTFGFVDEVIKEKSAQVLKLSEPINVEGFEIDYKEDGLSEVPLLKTGKYSHPVFGELNITSDVLYTLKTNFENNVRGIDVSIDYTHDNEKGESPAACWVKDLVIRSKDDVQELIAKSEFTPKGREKVLSKEYRYASADFVIDYINESGEHIPYVLRGGTLTNRPFIKEMEPIKLSEIKNKHTEVKLMNKEALLNLLKEQHGLNVAEMEASISSLKSETLKLQNQIKELNALPAQKEEEIKTLKEKLLTLTNDMNQKEKESTFEELMKEGKVLPAQKDKILAKFGTANEIKDWYSDAPQVVKIKADGDGGSPDAVLTKEEQEFVNANILTKEDIVKNRSIKN